MAQQRAHFFDSSPGTPSGGVTFSPAPPTYHAYFGAPGIQAATTDNEFFFDAVESSGQLVDQLIGPPLLDSGCTPTITHNLQDLVGEPRDELPDDGWDFADPWLDDADVAVSYFGSQSKGFGG